MVKLLPIVVLVALFAGALFYIRSQSFLKSPLPAAEITKKIESSASSPLEDKIRTLEDSVKLLASELGKTNLALEGLKKGGAQNTTSPMTDTKIKNLETQVTDLQNQINTLKSPGSQTTQTSTKKSPAYIPLGSGGNTTDKNYYSINAYQVSIDPGDYPGYSNMQLEATLNLNEAVGTINARLYNSADSSAISSSNVSTTSTTATLVTSSGFTLPAGKKTYVLQVQSTQGYQANIQSARIRVNF